MPAQRWFWILVGVAVALALASTRIAFFFTEIWWFEDLGYSPVFWTIVKARWLVALAGGLLFFVVALSNLAAVMWKRRRLDVVGGLVMPVPVQSPDRLWQWILVAAAVVGVLGGLSGYSQWHVVLAHLNATSFGIDDPFFAKDVGFYIFNLPFIRLLQQHLWVAFIAALALSAVMYFIFGDLRLTDRRVIASRRARVHISILSAVLFGLKAWSYRIDMWNLMYSPRGAAFGASYTDIHAQVPAYKGLMAVALVGVGFSLMGLVIRNFRWIGYAVLGMVVMSFAVGYAYPAFIQQFTVSPNEIAYEEPFIEKNITFTRDAFALNNIDIIEYPAEDLLTREDILNNPDTVANLRLWDYRVLKDTFSQVQEIRMYYRFNDVDIDRYVVNGDLRQVLLSPRELDVDLLPGEAKTWINLHLKYTHGYGVVMSPSRVVTGDGMPAFYFKDVPPRTTTDLLLDRPELYFGELTNHYIIVNTKEPEFDYPTLDSETLEPTFYQGKAGIRLDSLIKKLAFTIRFRDYQILVSGALTPDSRLIMRRNIVDRVQRIAPFFLYDKDPYLVVADGRLYWIIDGYTVSSSYPYSQPDSVMRVNYMRNAVKAVIDAYDGTTSFYRADQDDPILKMYESIFPGLIRPIEEMPVALKRHIRFPQDLFMVQARMLKTYHMTDPKVFYNKEDYWEIPSEYYGDREIPVEPYYILASLPGETVTEYVHMIPFTPRGKPNMVAWLAVRCEPERYGQMLLYRLPKDKHIPGPMQVESLISQNPEIAEAMTLWGQAGSQVIRGNLVTIPMDGSFLYVEPLYIQAERVKIPELKRVIMYAGGQVAMGTSVEDALNRLVGWVAEPPSGESEPGEITGLPDLIARANEVWSEAQARLRSGDWAGYGELIEELGEILRQLQRHSTGLEQ
ncbi:MAG: UPF0182 family protein [Bacillota bacterium]|jgi:uncharacterized membrane protein (UPF0182 family)|nr:UPF0182 family protein [Candidatus Fermentithermobacillaceae bacterium]